MNDAVDPAWLPDAAFRAAGTRRVLVRGAGPLVCGAGWSGWPP
ncbi:hypothetical protein ACH4D3_01305 [Streptomyces sp. NPDC018026]